MSEPTNGRRRRKSSRRPVEVAVLLPDSRLPYAFTEGVDLADIEAEAIQRLQEALASLEGYHATILDDHRQFIDRLREGGFDMVLNFCDTGFYNEDLISNIPSLCEILHLPCTGSPAVAIDAAGDKTLVGAFAASLGIPVPADRFVDLTVEPFPAPSEYPALIKPNVGGGSYGVTRRSVVHNADEADRYLHWLASYIKPPEAVIQEFLSGKEYTVSVIGNIPGGLTILPPAVVDYSGLDTDLPRVFTFAGKYDPDSRYWDQLRHKRADLDKATLKWIEEACTILFMRLRCRDYARFDFRADSNGVLKLLDANPNPAWQFDSRMALSAGWAGYDYARLILLILQTAEARYR
jgi:D-alanine-D-alanine ligase